MFDSVEKYGIAYYKILAKFSGGQFTMGKDCKIPHYIREGHIRNVPVEERSAGLCIVLMGYGRCALSDVPEVERTREFYLGAYSGTSLSDDRENVLNYIRRNIKDFDRQFFKDLIVTNKFSTNFEGNCFEIMPLEYIDEEMCSLAILHSTHWSDNYWLKTVYRRKPEALTSDIWKLAVRLYARTNNAKELLKMTPDEYKDEEYYYEMCSSEELSDLKKGIMEFLPPESVTPMLLGSLLGNGSYNVKSFNEVALETELPIPGQDNTTVLEKAWKVAVIIDGYSIKYIPLNEERVEFFLSLYDKDSSQYRFGFKDNYKLYMKKLNNPEALEKAQQTARNSSMILATVIFGCAMSNSPDATNEKLNLPMSSLLPIKYCGIIPQELCKEYDSEEYLALQYLMLGIVIIEDYDDLLYRVSLPEGWTIENDGYVNYVKDKSGATVITYCYDGSICDRDAYVKTIILPVELNTDGTRKL